MIPTYVWTTGGLTHQSAVAATPPEPKFAHDVVPVRSNHKHAVVGPGGYHHEYHQKIEAEALAAFWSGDDANAARLRKQCFIARGLLPQEDVTV